MNKKIIAISVVIVLIVASVAVYFALSNKDKDEELNILAAVNLEGSGIYVKSGIDIDTMFDFSTPIPTPIKEGWGGKIIGTPGSTSIQHTQIMDIVKNQLHMEFTKYSVGDVLDPNKVYFDSGVTNAALALSNTLIAGGILWQPQYQKIISDSSGKYKALATTDMLFPEHPCCVLAGVHAYTSGHYDETVKLLAAYIKAVDWVNNALADESSTDYAKLLAVAKNIAGSSNFTDNELKAALRTVVYTYGNNSSDPLGELSDNIEDMIVNLTEAEAISATVQDSGFGSVGEFVDRFVDDQFLVDAMKVVYDGEPVPGESEKKADLTVAVISGDIHQIAIHMAKELGYFEDYGLNVSFSYGVNGSGVATSLRNGNSSFGLLGAPPLTTSVINGKLIEA